MKPRVLMFLSSLNPAGGVEQYVVSVLPELQRLGVKPILCMEDPPDPANQYARRLRELGVRIHYPHIGPWAICRWSWAVDSVLVLLLPITLVAVGLDMLLRRRSWRRSYDGLRGRINDVVGRWLPDWSPSVPAWILLSWLWMRYRPHILHVLRADSVAAIEWGLRRGVPTIYTEALEPGGDRYYPHMRPYYERLENVIGRVSAIVTQSERVRRSIEQQWPATCETYVLPWVVDVPPANGARQGRGRDGKIGLGSAGRLAPEKDLGTFLEAAKLLLDAYPEGVQFVVAGGGPVQAELQAYARDLDLGSRLRFTGAYSLEEMPDIYGMFDIFVISSLTEGAPLAVMEAMAYNKPVVATDIAGTGELVQDGQTGFLVSPRDPAALAQACSRFIENPGLVPEMGRSARRRYEQCYAPAAGAQHLVDLYVKLAREKARS